MGNCYSRFSYSDKTNNLLVQCENVVSLLNHLLVANFVAKTKHDCFTLIVRLLCVSCAVESSTWDYLETS